MSSVSILMHCSFKMYVNIFQIHLFRSELLFSTIIFPLLRVPPVKFHRSRFSTSSSDKPGSLIRCLCPHWRCTSNMVLPISGSLVDTTALPSGSSGKTFVCISCPFHISDRYFKHHYLIPCHCVAALKNAYYKISGSVTSALT
jgi:hypothetical protein